MSDNQTVDHNKKDDLLKKLDNDLDDLIDSLIKKGFKYEHGWNEENWEEEMEKHPAFRTKPFEVGEELPTEFEALRQLKYDEDATPNNKALTYKDEGNTYFGRGQNRLAVDAYTCGIRVQCDDTDLNTVLYTNRAAAHYHLGNFRSSLQDTIRARKLKPQHMKAILRSCMCCQALALYSECITSCDAGLSILSLHQPTTDDKRTDHIRQQLLSLRTEADQSRRKRDKEGRRRSLADVKIAQRLTQLCQAIKDRGVTIDGIECLADASECLADASECLADASECLADANECLDGDNECLIANKSDGRMLSLLGYDLANLRSPQSDVVTLVDDTDGHTSLSWPVLFLYPEYGQCDLIQHFSENARFSDHIGHMFSPDTPPSWDTRREYQPEHIQVYFEDKKHGVLHAVDPTSTLLAAMKHASFTVSEGKASFILLVKQSQFADVFLQKYTVSTITT